MCVIETTFVCVCVCVCVCACVCVGMHVCVCGAGNTYVVGTKLCLHSPFMRTSLPYEDKKQVPIM